MYYSDAWTRDDEDEACPAPGDYWEACQEKAREAAPPSEWVFRGPQDVKQAFAPLDAALAAKRKARIALAAVRAAMKSA